MTWHVFLGLWGLTRGGFFFLSNKFCRGTAGKDGWHRPPPWPESCRECRLSREDKRHETTPAAENSKKSWKEMMVLCGTCFPLVLHKFDAAELYMGGLLLQPFDSKRANRLRQLHAADRERQKTHHMKPPQQQTCCPTLTEQPKLPRLPLLHRPPNVPLSTSTSSQTKPSIICGCADYYCVPVL